MPNGELHSGKTHGKTSVKLFHFKDLSKKAQEKANGLRRKKEVLLKKKKKKKKKGGY